MAFLYEYNCKDHGHFERLSKLENRDNPKPCPECGSLCKRVQSVIRFKLEGISGHFPTAADKWASMHEKEGRKVDS